MYPHRQFDHPGWEFAGHLVWAALVVALVAGVVLLVVRTSRHAPTTAITPPAAPMHPSAPDPALALARQRYAAGEITRDDYLRLVADLDPNHPGPGAEPPA